MTFIMSLTAAPVGEVTTPTTLREARYRAFALLCKKPLRFKLFLELFKSNTQSARSVGLHILDIELILTVALKDADAPSGDNFHAVFGHEAEALVVILEHDRAHCRLLILEGHIKMPCAVMIRKIRYLPADEHRSQVIVRIHNGFYISIKLTYCYADGFKHFSAP